MLPTVAADNAASSAPATVMPSWKETTDEATHNARPTTASHSRAVRVGTTPPMPAVGSWKAHGRPFPGCPMPPAAMPLPFDSAPVPIQPDAGDTIRRMSNYRRAKHRIVTAFQRRIGNPILMRMPGRTVLETTGRSSGLPRRTPIGGRLVGRDFWLVSEYGEKSQYVRDIRADARVRVRIRGRWHAGIAHPMPDDDARARPRALPVFNSAGVRLLGTDLLTIRVELLDDEARRSS